MVVEVSTGETKAETEEVEGRLELDGRAPALVLLAESGCGVAVDP